EVERAQSRRIRLRPRRRRRHRHLVVEAEVEAAGDNQSGGGEGGDAKSVLGPEAPVVAEHIPALTLTHKLMRLTPLVSVGVKCRGVVVRALAFMVFVASLAGAAAADQVEDLARTAQEDRSEKARIAAVIALGRLADPRGEPALVHALDDPSVIVRDV